MSQQNSAQQTWLEGNAEVNRLNGIYIAQGKRPEVVHLLSKSLPRSGHHHLAGILGRLYAGAFEYCEFYQPSDEECCKQQPCRKFCTAERMCGNTRHITMQKSHDYTVNDPVYEPNDWLKYVIMVRTFKHAVSSEIKLFLINHFASFLAIHGIDSTEILEHHDKALYRKALALIDQEGFRLSPRVILPFLHHRFIYYQGFMNKWLPFAMQHPGKAILINFNDLVGENRRQVVDDLVSMIGVPPDISVDEALNSEPLMTPAERSMEDSRAASELIQATRQLFEYYDASLKSLSPIKRAWRWV